MKRLTFLLIFVASLGYSQSNLVFNRVLNFKLGFQENVTVPEGKVWKVEEFHNSGNTANALHFTNPSPEVGNPVNDDFYVFDERPVWFEEGVILEGNGQVISVLEFNVVNASSGSGDGSGGLSSEGLQFSRVINYSDDHRFLTPNLFWHDYEPIEIPDGKVWKITSINVSSMSISSNPDVSPYMYRPHDQTFVTIGDIISVYEEGTNGGYGAYPYNNRSEEIWLNEGLKTIKVTNGDSEKIRLTFTAIEYNIPQ